MECDDPRVAKFNFRGVGVRFDKKAFALVTRLKCGKLPSYDETNRLTSRLWHNYFGPNNDLPLKEFIYKFACHPFNQSEVDDNVNVAIFYLLEYVFLSGDKRKLINNTNLKIIEDDVLRTICLSLKIFVYIGVWRFETIPIPNLMNYENYFPNNYPRILCWEFPRLLHFDKLYTRVFNTDNYPVNNMLVPTEEEENRDWVTTFYISGMERTYCSPPSVYLNGNKLDAGETVNLTVQPTISVGTSEVLNAPSTSNMNRLEKKINKLQAQLDGLTKIVRVIMQHVCVEENVQQPTTADASKQLHEFDAADIKQSVVTISPQPKKINLKISRVGRTLKKLAMLHSPFTPLQDSVPPIGRGQMNFQSI
ncbi:hypothetical protein FNV43_RR10866 [Rhamnella rubrinervis]|uniref:DUF1985 domain-containing protein n=1 Tax=Rhamnella rubrinervis TaxID=2594499 RepID=A0A8K0H4Q5_9ROSA|nr:hypothetical protein FNV43_RR10866 [Rhamnella rubrinervis]